MKLTVTHEVEIDLRAIPVTEWPKEARDMAQTVFLMYRRNRQQDLFLKEFIVSRVERRMEPFDF